MADDREGPSAKDVAFAAMAQSQISATQSYLQKGRQFEGLDDQALASRWVHEMRTWAKSIREKPTALDDAAAEYRLRQKEAPYHLVASEVEEIIAAVSRVHDAMSDEDRDRANAAMTAEYEADQRSRN